MLSLLLALVMMIGLAACASAEERTVSEIIKDPISATLTDEHAETLSRLKETARAQYGENKRITDENYDKSLAVKCVNGTFIGRKADSIIVYRGIPFVGEQPVGELRWKAPVDVAPDDGVYEAYYNGKCAPQREVEHVCEYVLSPAPSLKIPSLRVLHYSSRR